MVAVGYIMRKVFRMLWESRREKTLRRSAVQLQQARAACGQRLRRFDSQNQAQIVSAHRCRESKYLLNIYFIFYLNILYSITINN